MLKADVNYRQHEKCQNCDHFYPLNSCEKVDGNISPENVCDNWEIKSPKEVKNKEFFQKQFNKSSPGPTQEMMNE